MPVSEKEQNDLPPCLIYIDKEGKWYHKGVEMIRRDFIRLFFENMKMDARGRYVIHWGGKDCYVDVADTAYVVRNVDYRDAAGDAGERVMLLLSDDSEEDLIPETLRVGKDHVLYCRVKQGKFPARFSRAAYYRLATLIREEAGGFYLPLNGKQYRITHSPGHEPGP